MINSSTGGTRRVTDKLLHCRHPSGPLLVAPVVLLINSSIGGTVMLLMNSSTGGTTVLVMNSSTGDIHRVTDKLFH